MALDTYGVLKGRVISRSYGNDDQPHYQVHVMAARTHYRVAINVRSNVNPADLQYVVDDTWAHPLRPRLEQLPDGFTRLGGGSGVALDYVRGSLFRRAHMRVLPYEVPGANNDLNEKLDSYILRAMDDRAWTIYAWGEPWGPDPGYDRLFGFRPQRGMHDVHMNQGSMSRFADKDSPWQDGGIVLHHPQDDRWIGIFLKFQSQSWETHDDTGQAQDDTRQ